MRGATADAIPCRADWTIAGTVVCTGGAAIDFKVSGFADLDFAVDNAGTDGRLGPVAEQSPETCAATFDTNVLGTLLSMEHELGVMQAQGSGSIVNISSTYGHRGVARALLYAASKHAVEGMTKSAALEVAASGIRINAIAPGRPIPACWTGSPPTPGSKAAMLAGVPLRRLATSEEIARGILFVASDAASFMTGQVLSHDGGKSAG